MLTRGMIGTAFSIAAVGALTVIATGPAAAAGADCHWTTDANGIARYVCPATSPGKDPGNPQDTEDPQSDPPTTKRSASSARSSPIAPGRSQPSAGGAPTPAQLLQRALKVLSPPFPAPQTAPPRGTDAAVGLPVWVWVNKTTWKPITERAAAGAVCDYGIAELDGAALLLVDEFVP
jgi:hypothetical protein